MPQAPSNPIPPPVRAAAVRTPSVRAPKRIVVPGYRNLQRNSSFLVSLVVHAVALILLALLGTPPSGGHGGVALFVAPGSDEAPPEWSENPAVSFDAAASAESLAQEVPREVVSTVELPEVTSSLSQPQTAVEPAQPTTDMQRLPTKELLAASAGPIGGGLEGRTVASRARLVGERGGTPGSENAVETALAWLAQHQQPNGSWSLMFSAPPCGDRCTHPGLKESTTGATALALLPFLGAGYTHQAGPHQATVRKGLYYLTTRMVETERGGDFTENVTMYAQGLSTMALCEAISMTGDENLRPFAQKAVDYICYAQHSAGGWRYFPGEPGDTTVTGWQVMALKSARLARLRVPSITLSQVSKFLDQKQESNGAFYGYLTPDKQPGSTSVGLLLRMYQGWQREDDRLTRGVNYLAYLGPSKTDIYFNYYATMVMNHYGGTNWQMWNPRMRDYLVKTQATSGHERGSWYFADRHGTVGGRLYTTAMAAMILEVYYRFLPLYGDSALAEPL